MSAAIKTATGEVCNAGGEDCMQHAADSLHCAIVLGGAIGGGMSWNKKYEEWKGRLPAVKFHKAVSTSVALPRDRDVIRVRNSNDRFVHFTISFERSNSMQLN